ncbi:collagen binding domain-containing protein [Clostridium sp. MB05]
MISNKKIKPKILSIIVTIFFLIQMSFPAYANDNLTKDENKAIDTIKSVVLKDSKGNIIDENTEYPMDQGAKVSLFYNWEIGNGEEVKSGDYTEIQVPKVFSIYNTVEGDLYIGDGESVGKFYLSMDGKLRLVFNDYANTHSNVKGTVQFNSEFNKEVIKGENPVKITFPISNKEEKTIVIRFKPENIASSVEKSGIANKPVNSDKIAWTIDVNKTLAKVDNALIEDIFDESLSFEEASLKVYKLNVNLDGSTTLGDIVDSSKYTFDKTKNGFKLNLGSINSAYRISYSTKIIDRSKTLFSNKANFNGEESTGKVTINKGSDLSKKGEADKTFNSSKIKWTIDINKSMSNINEAIVEDTMQAGLSLDKSSVNVYKLTLNDDGSILNKTIVNPSEYTLSFEPYENPSLFKVNLGNISDSYQIEYDTNITDKTKTSFSNNASFSGQNVSYTVNIRRGSLISKSGKETIGYNEKYIIWTIDVNTGEESIDQAIVEDTIKPGLSFDKNSPKVYKLKLDSNGNATIDGDALPGYIAEDIKNENGNTSFKVNLGNINSAYRLVYRTDITNNDEVSFSNEAFLNGVGTGNIIKRPTITNSFTKSSDGSIDYSKKTMGWKITINPLKEPIKDLVIRDTFPNGGLSLISDTFIVKKGNTTLKKDINYKLELIEANDLTKGFKVIFLEDVKDALYTITYRTNFDPEIHLNIANKTKYVNEAVFTGSNIKAPITKSATQTVSNIASDNGNKSGVLDRNKKEITWTINLNYLSKNLGSIEVLDTIKDNQVIDKDSIEVYEYSVEANGNMKIGQKVDSSKYTIKEINEKSFKIEINSATSAYRIIFKTKIIGKSQSEYLNTATVGDVDYSGKVTYTDHDKFVEKEGQQIGRNIKWRIAVNKSLSEIENATLVDTLSEGHQVIEDSFKVYKASDNSLYTDYKVTVNPPDLTSGKQMFKFEFLKPIDTMYYVEYETKIITDVDYSKISNSVHFEGDGFKTENQPFEKEIVVRITDGSGTGSGEVGSLRIVKVDADNEETKLSGAEFDLYDSKERFIGKAVTDENGVIEVPKLKFGRYTLQEVKAPVGYQLLDEERNIEVSISSKEKLDLVVKNYKLGSISIIKTDNKNKEKLLQGAKFELRNLDNEVIETLTTNEKGEAKFTNIPYGEYKLVEIEAPKGYLLNNNETEIKIDREVKDINLNIENEEIPLIPEKPELLLGSISIKKVDSNNKEKLLQGAKFELRNLNNEVIETVVTGENGEAKFINIPYGEYKLVEIEAPKGYVLDKNEQKITINEENKEIKLEIKNSKDPIKPEEPSKPNNDITITPKNNKGLPKTGGRSTAGLYVLALATISLGLYLRKNK